MGITNQRLNLIASQISDEIVYDIGSDHGYLPLKMLLEDKVKKVFICEKNQQPLNNAIKNFKLNSKYKPEYFVLSDGFKDIDHILENSSIVIAGMGGNLIADIIRNGLNKIPMSSTLYLQPNNNTYNLRKFLCLNGFIITKELLIKENDIINEIIIAKFSTTNQDINEEFLKFGISINYDHELFNEYWTNRLNHLNNIKQSLEETNNKNEKIDIEINLITNKLGGL